MKKIIKTILYYTGLVTLFHRVRNRRTLTVLMLHRILPAELIDQFGANPEWTMTPEVFEVFLKFLKQNYTPVDAAQVEAWRLQGTPLPPNALLVTFDDGWRDNYQYARPVLLRQQVPALIFIVSETIGQRLPFWQELIFSCCRNDQQLKKIMHMANSNDNTNVLDLISQLSTNSEMKDRREQIIDYCNRQMQDMPRQLLTENEIRELVDEGFAVGSHGATHSPLGKMDKQHQISELHASKQRLEQITGQPNHYISYPHGSSSKDTFPLCLKSGYKVVFNSKISLNAEVTDVIARLHISEQSISSNGKFDPMKACYRLFFVNR